MIDYIKKYTNEKFGWLPTDIDIKTLYDSKNDSDTTVLTNDGIIITKMNPNNNHNYNNHGRQEDNKEIKNLLTQEEKIMKRELSESDIVISNKLGFGVFNLKPEIDNTSDTESSDICNG